MAPHCCRTSLVFPSEAAQSSAYITYSQEQIMMQYYGEYMNMISNNIDRTKCERTIYPTEYAHGRVVFYFAVILLSILLSIHLPILFTVASLASGLSTHLPMDEMAATFEYDIFKCISTDEKCCISIPISWTIVRGPIDNKTALVQIMTWRRTCEKPSPESMLTQFVDAYMRH